MTPDKSKETLKNHLKHKDSFIINTGSQNCHLRSISKDYLKHVTTTTRKNIVI